MATNIQQISEQAMKLPGESRAQLADMLVESLDAEALGTGLRDVKPVKEFGFSWNY